jgi:FlaA1/EpsC-like NDP-sugar epimerase
MRRDGTCRRNVLVIGAGEAGNQLIKEINNSRYVKKKVVASKKINSQPARFNNSFHIFFTFITYLLCIKKGGKSP